MEIEPSTNISAAESATGIGSDKYIDDVNVIILNENIQRVDIDESLCEIVHFNTTSSCLVSKNYEKVNDHKVAELITDTSEEKEVAIINVDDNENRANYADTSKHGQHFGIKTTFVKEEASSLDETQILIHIEDASSTVERTANEVTQKSTGTRFLNDLYEKEVDIKNNFSDQEILDIQTAVDQQVKLLAETIGEIDPRLRIREVIPAGSAREGTNIVRPCEYDYILELGAFSNPGSVSLILPEEYLKDVSLEFVQVKLEDSELRSLFQENIHDHDILLASKVFRVEIKEGLKDMCNAAVFRAVKLCLNESVEKKTGHLTCKSSKPEVHGPACTVMLNWHRQTSETPLKISVDLCLALRIPWEVYEFFLQSNDCDVSCDFKTRIQNVGSILLMPNSATCAFKVTFTEAELLLTSDLSEHHIKCYKLLKYITQIEINPFQSYSRKIKYFFQDKTSFPSYALKIMMWNHQFTKHCFEETDFYSCVYEILSNWDCSSLEENHLKHPANRNGIVKIVSDGSGRGRMWSRFIKRIPFDGPRRIEFRIPYLIRGLKSIQKGSIDKYDYETYLRKLHIRGYGRYYCSLRSAATFVLILAFYFWVAVCIAVAGGFDGDGFSAGAPASCVTEDKVLAMNGTVQQLLLKLAASGLVTVDMATMNATIPDDNIPDLLDLLCNTTETKAHMQQLVSKAQACPDQMLTAMGLKALQIKGVGFAEMFAPFGDVDHSCGNKPEWLTSYTTLIMQRK